MMFSDLILGPTLKTPNMKMFGVLLLGFNSFLIVSLRTCECSAAVNEDAQLKRVYDGDTMN